MKDYAFDYWKEAVEAALEELGVVMTDDQVEHMAGSMQVSADNQGMAFGHDVASHNLSQEREQEVEKLKQELRDEQEKRGCPECSGRGYYTVSYGTFSSPTTCSRCKGEGKI